MKPKTSVVIACYNEETKIEKCINSLLNQTLKPYEIIFVDGGSTDNTVTIIKKFQKKSNLIKLFFETGKRSPANARNIGWKASKGNYILFLDADSEFNTNFIDIINRTIVGIDVKETPVIYQSIINSWKEVFLKYFWYGRTIPKYLLRNKKDYKTIFATFVSFGLVVLPILALFWWPYVFYLLLLDLSIVLGTGLKNSIECYKRSNMVSFFITMPIYNLLISLFTGIGIVLAPLLFLTGKYNIGR